MNGGAIFAQSDINLEIIDSKFEQNNATIGGAIFLNQIWQHKINFENLEFSLNEAT